MRSDSTCPILPPHHRQSHNDRSQDLVEALQRLVGAGKMPAPESAFSDPAVWTAFNGAATAFACAHVTAIGDSPHDQPKISLLAEAMVRSSIPIPSCGPTPAVGPRPALVPPRASRPAPRSQGPLDVYLRAALHGWRSQWVLTLAAMADETPVATILPLLTRVLTTARLTSQEPLVQTALPCLGLLAMRYPDHGDAVMTALRTFVTDPAPILAVLATSDASSAHRLAQAAGVTYARLLRVRGLDGNRAYDCQTDLTKALLGVAVVSFCSLCAQTQSSAPTDKASESQRRKSISSLVVSKFAWPPSKSTEPVRHALARTTPALFLKQSRPLCILAGRGHAGWLEPLCDAGSMRL